MEAVVKDVRETVDPDAILDAVMAVVMHARRHANLTAQVRAALLVQEDAERIVMPHAQISA